VLDAADLETDVMRASSRAIEAGLDALSMRVFAQRLGVGTPSLYRYFPNKDTLVRTLSATFLTDA
jgi:AcrR family transcriptional regulator